METDGSGMVFCARNSSSGVSCQKWCKWSGIRTIELRGEGHWEKKGRAAGKWNKIRFDWKKPSIKRASLAYHAILRAWPIVGTQWMFVNDRSTEWRRPSVMISSRLFLSCISGPKAPKQRTDDWGSEPQRNGFLFPFGFTYYRWMHGQELRGFSPFQAFSFKSP